MRLAFPIATLALRILMVVSSATDEAEFAAEEMHLNHFLGLDRDECARQILETSEETRVRLYTYLRDHLESEYWRSSSKLDTTRMLFALGEPQARRELIEKFRDDPYDGGQNLSWLGDPAIIEAMVPYVFGGDSSPIGDPGGDQIPSALPFRALMVTLQTINHSYAFTPEVKEWAKRNSWIGTGRGGLEVFRRWWVENAGAFAKKDYKKVKPGDEFPPVSAVSMGFPTPVLSEPSLPTSVANASTHAVSVVDASSPPSVFLWAGAGIALASLVGLGIFWKRRV